MIAEADSLIDWAKAHGINVNPGSRLPAHANWLRQHDGRVAFTGPQLEQVVTARLEVEAFDFVRSNLHAPVFSEDWREKTVQAINGPFLVNEGRDPARDAFAELYVAALFRASRLPVKAAEPDVVVRVGLGRYGCAVKRPRTATAIKDKLREAMMQVSRHRPLAGVAIFDLTLSLGLHRQMFRTSAGSSPVHLGHAIRARIEKTLAPHVERCRGTLCAVLGYATAAVLDSSGNNLTFVRPVEITPLNRNGIEFASGFEFASKQLKP